MESGRSRWLSSRSTSGWSSLDGWKIVSKHSPGCVVALVGVGRECGLREEGEAHLASSSDLSMVDHLRSADQLAEIVPIECGGIVELRKEGFRVEPGNLQVRLASLVVQACAASCQRGRGAIRP